MHPRSHCHERPSNFRRSPLRMRNFYTRPIETPSIREIPLEIPPLLYDSEKRIIHEEQLIDILSSKIIESLAPFLPPTNTNPS